MLVNGALDSKLLIWSSKKRAASTLPLFPDRDVQVRRPEKQLSAFGSQFETIESLILIE